MHTLPHSCLSPLDAAKSELLRVLEEASSSSSDDDDDISMYPLQFDNVIMCM